MEITVRVTFEEKCLVPDDIETDFDVASYVLPLLASLDNVIELSVELPL